MTPTNERQRAHLYIYVAKKLQNDYIYTQKARHFAKIKTVCVRFYSQKSTHYTLRKFHDFLKLAFISIQKE